MYRLLWLKYLLYDFGLHIYKFNIQKRRMESENPLIKMAYDTKNLALILMQFLHL